MIMNCDGKGEEKKSIFEKIEEEILGFKWKKLCGKKYIYK